MIVTRVRDDLIMVVDDQKRLEAQLASPIHEAGILGCSDCVQPIAV